MKCENKQTKLTIFKEKLPILQHVVGMEVKLLSFVTLIWITETRY